VGLTTAATTDQIRERLAAVRRRIDEAADRSGRESADVRLVVVTKGHPVSVLNRLIECGQLILGENRVEEAVSKIDAVVAHEGLEWHLVGALQSRKVRLVEGRFHLLHAVDRLKIARLLEAQAGVLGRRQAVLLEWNVSGEASKAGWRAEDEAGWQAAVRETLEIACLPHLAVLGLMTVGAPTPDVAIQRQMFRRLADLRKRLVQILGRDLPELSMGMTDDFEAAVEEGATLVRIGRAILGERM